MAKWLPLSLSQKDYRGPPLYVKPEIREKGYRVAITDVVRIWEEVLDWKEVVKRSLNENTAIDLLEDDQRSVFFDYLRSPFAGETDTALAIYPGRRDTELTLRLHAKLPPPFNTLVWNFYLKIQPQECLAEAFTFPALLRLKESEESNTLLMNGLREKDRVIAKLMNRLQSMRVALSDVYPNIRPPKGKSSHKDDSIFHRKVAGLKPFDEEQLHEAKKAPPSSDTTANLLVNGLDPAGDMGWRAPKAWWDHIASEHESMEICFVPDSQPKASSLPTRERTQEPDVIRMFLQYRQKTHKWQSLRTRSNLTATSQSVFENDAANPFVRVRKSVSPPKAQVQAQRRTEPQSDGGSGASDDVDERKARDDDKQSSTSVDLEQKPAPTNTKSRLGAIGGKRKGAEMQESLSANDGDAQHQTNNDTEHKVGEDLLPAEPTTPAGKRRLGRIGGHKASTSTTPSKPEKHRLPPSTVLEDPGIQAEQENVVKHEATALPGDRFGRETSIERADKQRAEKEKELEAKRKAPAKKKRKF